MALSANLARNIAYGGPEAVNHIPVAASAVIYQGSAVGNSAGYGRPLNAGDRFLGFALHNGANNASGSAGAIDVEVVTKGVLRGVSITGITTAVLAALNNVVYMSDDGTFTSVIGSNSRIGKITRFDSNTSKCDIYFEATTHTHGT